MKIKEIQGTLKESTKKLCRLFKENTNLELDAKKVRSEREELISMLDTFMKNIDSGQMDNFIEQIDQELSDENNLSELLKQEKDLADQIKVLRWSTRR